MDQKFVPQKYFMNVGTKKLLLSLFFLSMYDALVELKKNFVVAYINWWNTGCKSESNYLCRWKLHT